MKKTFLILAMLFASFSSNLALGYTQSMTYTRGPRYEMNDYMHVNINSYCSILQISGNFNPSAPTGDPYDTYCDFGVYHIDPSSYYTTLVSHFYFPPHGFPDSSFTYSNSNYSYWNVIYAIMNISNGTGTVTVEWY